MDVTLIIIEIKTIVLFDQQLYDENSWYDAMSYDALSFTNTDLEMQSTASE